jgi:DNA topoisomerase III
MKVLCVAEKPSIARAVSQILAGGRFEVSPTNNKYIKNYKFMSRFPQWGECDVVFTSVAGHLTEADFDQQWRKWATCAPVALFDEARIIETIPQVRRVLLQSLRPGIQGDLR